LSLSKYLNSRGKSSLPKESQNKTRLEDKGTRSRRSENKENTRPSTLTQTNGTPATKSGKSGSQETALGAYQILKHLLKVTLPAQRAFVQDNDTTKQWERTQFVHLGRAIAMCLESVENNEHLIQLQPLELEKLISNIVNRFVELNEFERALDLILHVFETRLSASKKLTTKQKPTTAASTAGKKDSKERTFESKLLKCLTFASKSQIKSSVKVSLIIVLLTNATRIWIDSNHILEDKVSLISDLSIEVDNDIVGLRVWPC
jgi:hypothetical protein